MNRYTEKEFENTKFFRCTAIPCRDEEDVTMRQDALLLITTLSSGERVESVVFGWRHKPHSAAEYADMCEDWGAWDALSPENHIQMDTGSITECKNAGFDPDLILEMGNPIGEEK